jgi:lysyl-tRNA synthetase class 2
MSIPFIEENDQTRARYEHLEELRGLVGNVYPNKFERSRVCGSEDTITAIVENFRKYQPQAKEGERPAQDVLESANAELSKVEVRISGRIAVPPRVMGKAAFVHLSDGVSRLQIYVRKADVVGLRNEVGGGTVDGWQLFNLFDHGDFIGVSGYLFITKTGELSVHVCELQFLAKAMLPMPDKMHGINDPEIRQRQRYADLIAGSIKVEREEGELTTREVFERRSKIISAMRHFLETHGYIEVETPMLAPKATGAAARPFKTHHNALDIDLYARIAPELYLKRLIVGGFEKIYELNRNFRNEGIDRTHNPEFTMLEFYCAYLDVNGMMDFCEDMLRTIVKKVIGDTCVRFGVERPIEGILDISTLRKIDFGPRFQRLTMKDAVRQYWYKDAANNYLSELELDGEEFNLNWLDNQKRVRFLFDFINNRERYRKMAEDDLLDQGILTEEEIELEKQDDVINLQSWQYALRRYDEQQSEPTEEETAKHVTFLFEELAEPHLKQPTFIYDFPKAVSPLSKASPMRPTVAERFELYIGSMEYGSGKGMECANGFSELNDPEEQYERFLEQAQQRERGDDEAMVLDEDYIRALSYGMPPAAGIGIGIDRLVMVLTGKSSIRDVILFPHMRPQRERKSLGKPLELTKLDGSNFDS